MTDTEKKIAVMQAYVDGKQIQYKAVDATIWHDVVEPLWDWSYLDYRVKPESKYRPYKDTDEMIEDFLHRFQNISSHGNWYMPLIWLRLANTEDVRMWLITEYGDNFVVMANSSYAMCRLFQEFTYLDGSPCGKLVEE